MPSRAEELRARVEQQRMARDQAAQGGVAAQQAVAQANQQSAPASQVQALRAQVDAQRQAALQVANPQAQQAPPPVAGGLEGVQPGGYSEAIATLTSSIVAEPIAGWAGVLGGTDKIDKVRNAITYQPRTDEGKAALAQIGGILSPIGNAIDKVSETLGDTMYDLTGNSFAGAVGYTLPHALLEAGPLGAIARARKASRLANASEEVRVATEILDDPIARVSEPTAGQWTLDKDNVAVPNVVGRQLMESGIEGSDAALITNSNPATKKAMQEVTEAFNRHVHKNPTGEKPSQVIGRYAAGVVKEINEERMRVGQNLADIVDGEIGQTPVSVVEEITAFNVALQQAGGVSRISPNGKRWLDFSKSPYADIRALNDYRSVLTDAFQLTSAGQPATLKQVHDLKRGLDSIIDAKKLEKGGKIGEAEQMLVNLRSALNNKISTVDGYAEVNQNYARLRNSLNAFDEFKPSGMSWDSPQAANRVGSALSNVSNDNLTVNNMLTALKEGNEVVSSISGKPFSVDVWGIARYNELLNEMFVKTTQSNINPTGWYRQAGQNVQGAAISAVVGNKYGVANNIAGLMAMGLSRAEASKVLARAVKDQQLVVDALKLDPANPTGWARQ